MTVYQMIKSCDSIDKLARMFFILTQDEDMADFCNYCDTDGEWCTDENCTKAIKRWLEAEYV